MRTTKRMLCAVFLGLVIWALGQPRELFAQRAGTTTAPEFEANATGLIPAAGPAQAAPAPAATAAANRTVTLDVVVTDKSGKAIAGLQPGDFKVLDNKQPRNIESLHEAAGANAAADPPLEVYLLVDTVNPGTEVIANEGRNLVDYLQHSGDHLALSTSFIFFTVDGLKFQQQPTHDPKVLLANLESNPIGQRTFHGSAGFESQVQMREKSLQALNLLAVTLSRRPGRKLVVWITTGWQAFPDLSSQKTAQEYQQLFNYIVSLSTALREARITLYSVDPQGAAEGGANVKNSYYQDFLKGVASPKQADNGDLFLPVIATQTGGKVLYGSNDTAKMIDQCLADAETYYAVTVDAPAATHESEYHGIQIQIDKPGSKARTITGYYAQP